MKLNESRTLKAHLNSTRSTHALVGARQGRAQLGAPSGAMFHSMAFNRDRPEAHLNSCRGSAALVGALRPRTQLMQ